MNVENDKISRRQREWEQGTLKKSFDRMPERDTYSELPQKRIYTPTDVADLDYLRDLGFPGEYPFTRGIHPAMYRSRFWSTAQYSGFGTPEDTNRRWRLLLDEGQEGVSLACDLPTQLGFDSDDPRAAPDVGVVGCACPSLREVETLFDGIPMDRVKIRGSTHHLGAILWSMFIAAAEKKGIPSSSLGGAVLSDCLTEYYARGNYVFPPRHALRLSLDLAEYSIKNVPQLTYFFGGHGIREAGCNLVQSTAFILATAASAIEQAQARGIPVNDFASRIGCNYAIKMNLFEEVAALRALRRLWARMLRDRFGATAPAAQQLRVGPGSSGLTLTAQQAENNIVRVTIHALAGILGGVQFLHMTSFDEALSLPTERAATIAFRTQQILAHETGVGDVIDPLAGSYYVESLTNEIEERVTDYLRKVDEAGGMMKAIETGWVQSEIARSAYQEQKDIEVGKKVVVGVNKFCAEERPALEIHRSDPGVAEEMRRRLEGLRKERDNRAARRALVELQNAARSNENLIPYTLEAVRNYATIGEMCSVLREVFGEYKAATL